MQNEAIDIAMLGLAIVDPIGLLQTSDPRVEELCRTVYSYLHGPEMTAIDSG